MKPLLLCLLLAGCAGQPHIVNSSPHQVSVSRANMTGSKGMLEMADRHCAAYGKHAEFIGRENDFTNVYACRKGE